MRFKKENEKKICIFIFLLFRMQYGKERKQDKTISKLTKIQEISSDCVSL